MINLLNEISALYIGIIGLVTLALIILLFFVLNFKRGIARTGLKVGVFIVALAVAIFAAKPLLSLFDGLFSFSTVFFTFFMSKFAGIDGLNVVVNSSSYLTEVQNFKTSNVGISATVKQFLVDIFENSTVPSERVTTLSAVASTTFSYFCALFIVALVLFFVVYGLLSLILNLITRHFGGNHEKRILKGLSGLIGLIEGVIVCVILLVTTSTIPFFGISTDFLASGFEKTVVMNVPYQFIMQTEQNLYKNTLNYGEINLNASQNLDEIKTGTYNNSDSTDDKWSIIFVIKTNSTSSTTISVNLTNTEDLTFALEECNYIYVNNSLYLFSTTQKKVMAICQYDKKEKTIIYTKTTEQETIKAKLKFITSSID